MGPISGSQRGWTSKHEWGPGWPGPRSSCSYCPPPFRRSTLARPGYCATRKVGRRSLLLIVVHCSGFQFHWLVRNRVSCRAVSCCARNIMEAVHCTSKHIVSNTHYKVCIYCTVYGTVNAGPRSCLNTHAMLTEATTKPAAFNSA
ncbi:hypothetical protein EXIGLDRAFT_59515 [Exidia glandulosa HHB12029]|uniref:Uncharacterized protein n=1 Tax=Exidia glandulosa HHB12029 TaxID=1314781 RepID=A0A165I5Q7_EXIGL|nr:hypothetical protein EXIGLDRAFT_59515 [Exidia glandulosa HHB12029]